MFPFRKKIISLESLGENHFLYDFDELMDFNFSSYIKDDIFIDVLKSEVFLKKISEFDIIIISLKKMKYFKKIIKKLKKLCK